MKKKVLILLTAFALTCLVGCGNNEAPASGNNPESSAVDPTKEPEPEITTEPSSEPEATVEPTPEATEEPVLYEGIDMESTLPAKEWLATFEGIITEPKLIVFNDETGRKEIIENGDTVNFNPDVDSFGIYLPKGAKAINSKTKGVILAEAYSYEHCEILKLNAELSREYGKQHAALYVEFEKEEIALKFIFIPE